MKVHLISIGGAVMHNLGLELQRIGHHVTGSDDEIFEPSKSRLINAGLCPETFGWFPDKITTNLDLVILGMHARIDNPELIRAQELGLKVQSFPEFIYEHAKDKTRIVIAGSHGKTTTTAMVMHILKLNNLDFDYLVGSRLEGFELMVGLSDAPIMVIEGDEYLSSPIDRRPKFLWYKPQIAVITGIAWDHINVFPTYQDYTKQFQLFVDSMPDKADLIYFDGDNDLVKICQNQNRLSLIPYHPPFNDTHDGLSIVKLDHNSYNMMVFGEHNLSNMQSAVYVCKSLNISEEDCWYALQSFTGTSRRLEKTLDTKEMVIFKDFAHSPSKVKATVEAVRSAYPGRKLIAFLELHTFSSLNKDFLPLYKNTMLPADVAVVHFNPDVFEMKKMKVLDNDVVKNEFVDVKVETDLVKLKHLAKSEISGNDVFLFMSSGHWGGIIWEEELH